MKYSTRKNTIIFALYLQPDVLLDVSDYYVILTLAIWGFCAGIEPSMSVDTGAQFSVDGEQGWRDYLASCVKPLGKYSEPIRRCPHASARRIL
jgi:hypothetical protein